MKMLTYRPKTQAKWRL